MEHGEASESFHSSRLGPMSSFLPQLHSSQSHSAQVTSLPSSGLCHDCDFYQLKRFRWLLGLLLADITAAIIFVLVHGARWRNLLVDGIKSLELWLINVPFVLLSYTTFCVFFPQIAFDYIEERIPNQSIQWIKWCLIIVAGGGQIIWTAEPKFWFYNIMCIFASAFVLIITLFVLLVFDIADIWS